MLQLDNGTSFRWTYTAAGRELSQSDPLTGTTIHPDATHDAGGNGRQAPWYPASMTYVSRSLAYDSYGRLSHLGLPEAPLASSLSYDYTPSQYDLEDQPIAEIANRYSQSNSGVGSNVVALECRPKNVRNEQLPQRAPFMNGVCSSIVPAHIDYNGTIMTPINQTTDTQAASVPWTIDARAGMLVSDLYTTTNGNPVNSSYVHDASGRLIQDYEGSTWSCSAPYGIGMLNPECFANGTRRKTYDAENRLRSESYTYPNPTTATATSYGATFPGAYWTNTGGGAGRYQPANLQAVDYDALSHPTRLSLFHPDYGPSYAAEVRAWLWDGNDRFLTCQLVNSQCTSPSFSLEGLGDYVPAAGTISVNDRNRAGIVVTSHTAAAFQGWTGSVGSSFGAYHAWTNDPCSSDLGYCGPLE